MRNKATYPSAAAYPIEGVSSTSARLKTLLVAGIACVNRRPLACKWSRNDYALHTKAVWRAPKARTREKNFILGYMEEGWSCWSRPVVRKGTGEDDDLQQIPPGSLYLFTSQPQHLPRINVWSEPTADRQLVIHFEGCRKPCEALR